MEKGAKTNKRIQDLYNRNGLQQLRFSAGRQQVDLWRRGHYNPWLLTTAGAIDLNRLEYPELARTLQDHCQVKSIGLVTSASTANGVQLINIRHVVTPREPREIDHLGINHEWTLAGRFTSAFYMHRFSLAQFPRCTRSDEVVQFSIIKEGGKVRNDQDSPEGHRMGLWHKHVLFYSPKDNVACGLVLPPQTNPIRFQIGGAFGENLDRFSVTLFSLGSKKKTGKLDHRLTWLAYQPAEPKFWWIQGLAVALKLAGRTDRAKQITPILAMDRIEAMQGKRARLFILDLKSKPPTTVEVTIAATGKKVDITPTVKKNHAPHIAVVDLPTAKLPSNLYFVKVGSKKTCFIVRPAKPAADVLHILPTNQWRAYSANGFYYAARLWPYDYSFGATVLQSPAPGYKRQHGHDLPPNYIPPWWTTSDHGVLLAIEHAAKKHQLAIDFCSQEAIHFGQVDLSRYRLLIYGSHAEYFTRPESRALEQYLAGGGGLLTLGGDNFGRLVRFIPNNPDFRLQQYDRADGWNGKVTESEKLKRAFHPPYIGNIRIEALADMIVCDNNHPITKGYKLGQRIGKTYHEADITPEDFRPLVLSQFPCRGYGHSPATLAVHRKYPIVHFGPMGWPHALTGGPGNAKTNLTLFQRSVKYILDCVK